MGKILQKPNQYFVRLLLIVFSSLMLSEMFQRGDSMDSFKKMAKSVQESAEKMARAVKRVVNRDSERDDRLKLHSNDHNLHLHLPLLQHTGGTAATESADGPSSTLYLDT